MANIVFLIARKALTSLVLCHLSDPESRAHAAVSAAGAESWSSAPRAYTDLSASSPHFSHLLETKCFVFEAKTPGQDYQADI